MHLLEGGSGRVAEHPVDLRPGTVQRFRVLQQVVDGEGEQARRGLVAGDQERDALRTDVGVGKALAGLPVHAVQHPAEEVGGIARGSLGAPLRDQPVHQVVHEGLVLLHLPLRPDPQPGLQRQLACPCLGLGERSDHGLDERVRGLAVEGVEAIAEPAEGDGVQGQPGHVGRYVDLVAVVEPAPLVHQLVGDVEHPGHVVAHRLKAEGGHQDVVGAPPQGVVGLSREQSGARRALPEVGQAAPDQLVEPRVVAHLLDQSGTGDDQAGPAGDAQLEDRAVLLGHRHEALDGVVGVDVERVPDQGKAVRAGDLVKVDRHAHGGPASWRDLSAVARRTGSR